MKLSKDNEFRYSLFIKDVSEHGLVYALDTGEGLALVESNETDQLVLLVFSKESYAREVCIDEWEDYRVVQVHVEDFKNQWLDKMVDDNLLVGVNFDSNLYGRESSPKIVLEDLTVNYKEFI